MAALSAPAAQPLSGLTRRLTFATLRPSLDAASTWTARAASVGPNEPRRYASTRLAVASVALPPVRGAGWAPCPHRLVAASKVDVMVRSPPSRSHATLACGPSSCSIGATAGTAIPARSALASWSGFQRFSTSALGLCSLTTLFASQKPPSRSTPFRSRRVARADPPPSPPPPRPPHKRTLLATLLLNLNNIPSRLLLYTLIALNAAVFFAWQYAQHSLERYRDPRAALFMMANFLSGEANLLAGRWWTLVTSCISHRDVGHYMINMLGLFFMAEPVMAVVGNATFLALYFGAGVASCVVSLLWHRVVDPWMNKGGRGTGGYSLGASGSVYAIMTTFACMQPHATFLLFFVLPVPAWLCVSGIFAHDLYSAAMTPGSTTDAAGHVGGILAGILFWRFGMRGFRI
ncbi:hypothetical protein ACQY0O_007760 [Thecaphora frezii]